MADRKVEVARPVCSSETVLPPPDIPAGAKSINIHQASRSTARRHDREQGRLGVAASRRPLGRRAAIIL
jgi:hypothetical protein